MPIVAVIPQPNAPVELREMPNSDLSPEELMQVHTFYKQLEDLESIKTSSSAAERTMDKERDMEKLLAAVIRDGNPLAS